MITPAQQNKFPGLSLKAFAQIVAAAYPGAITNVKSGNVASIGMTTQATYNVVFTTPLATATYLVDFQCSEKSAPAATISAKTVNGFTMLLISSGAVNEMAGAVFSFGVYE